MKRSVWTILVLFFGSPLAAQDRALAAGVGDYARFNTTLAGDSSGTSNLRCEARITRLFLDTLVLRPVGRCALLYPKKVTIRDLQLEKNSGSRAAHILVGATLGVVGGAFAGVVIAGDGCRVAGCDDGSLAVATVAIMGAFSGGLIGSTIGFFRPYGKRWVDRPDRAARLDW